MLGCYTECVSLPVKLAAIECEVSYCHAWAFYSVIVFLCTFANHFGN